MTKIDPIIAVADVNDSAKWYESVFGCKRTHGGDDFAVLKDERGEVLICLHKWGEHDHPTMTDPDTTPGNGLIIYYKTQNPEAIHQKVMDMGYPVAKGMHLNPNSNRKEFSLRDLDGYYLTISEYHTYEG